MKKLLFLVVLLTLFPFVYGEETLIWVYPSRETILHFPSNYLSDKTVTVFLPEPAVPLHQKYPVVYVLGVSAKDATAVQEALDHSNHKAILVGIDLEPEDWQKPSEIIAFLMRELIPYIDTNYSTLDDPASRALAVSGAAGTRVAQLVSSQQKVFARAVLQNPVVDEKIAWSAPETSWRIILAGNREEIVSMQRLLEEKNIVFGSGFVSQLVDGKQGLFAALNLDYLFAADREVQVAKIVGNISPTKLSIEEKQTAFASFLGVLNNAMTFDYIPLSLRLSPPYLSWDATQGTLVPLSGAAPGTVKIETHVDKNTFQSKIKLKK